MRLFGREFTLKKAASLQPIGSGGTWFPLFDTTPGDWQKSVKPGLNSVASNNAVYACVTLISSDIGKLRPKLVEVDVDGIWSETTSPAFSPVLRKPNRFQNHIHFKEWWVMSKLLHGNTYALKERDQRGVVVAMYILDPNVVTPLVSPDGAVYYQLNEDNLAGLPAAQIIVPASEIFHDRMNCLFHPLIGTSPLYSCGTTAEQGLKIQKNSIAFFGNNSSPGGVLTAPGEISDPTADRIKKYWEDNYTGEKAGRIAVLGDGLKFEPMRMTAVESQLADQVNLSAKAICSAFHVPPFMVGLGDEPTYANGQTLQNHYYQRCLQSHIELMEECLADGFGMLTTTNGRQLAVELDLSGLLRMDTKTQMETLKIGVDGSLITPNEGRREINRKPIAGGDTIYMQQQNYSLEALANRDKGDPFAKPMAAPVAPAAPVPAAPPAAPDAAVKALSEAIAELRVQASTAEAQRLEREHVAERRAADSLEVIRNAMEQIQVERRAIELAKQEIEDETNAHEFANALIAKFTRAAHVE